MKKHTEDTELMKGLSNFLKRHAGSRMGAGGARSISRYNTVEMPLST